MTIPSIGFAKIGKLISNAIVSLPMLWNINTSTDLLQYYSRWLRLVKAPCIMAVPFPASASFSPRVHKSIWLGESVRTPLEWKCLKWHEEASSPSPTEGSSPTEGWRLMLGYVLRSPSIMSMHINPNSCQKCRSTSHPSFVHQGCFYYIRQVLPFLQTSMLKCWFLSEQGNHGLHGVLAAKYIEQ